MGLHAYCITRADHQPNTAGIDGAPVQSVSAGGLAAWASPHAAPPEPSIAALRAHDAVVRTAMTPTLTPVPLRFGQWAESAETLRTRVGEHADRWRELLDAFAGAVEFGVRIDDAEGVAAGPVTAPPAEPRPRSGREYLERLAARTHEQQHSEARRAAALGWLRAAVGGYVVREVSGAVPDGSAVAWVAHLVRREHADAYRHALDVLREREPGWRLRLTGPWPPYSFVT